MDYFHPPIKEKERKLFESTNKQFLSYFPDKPAGIPRNAWDTCDTHMTLKQSISFVDPKGNPVNEVYWDEPMDVNLYWEKKMNMVWFGIFIASSFFFFIIYYFWGGSHG